MLAALKLAGNALWLAWHHCTRGGSRTKIREPGRNAF